MFSASESAERCALTTWTPKPGSLVLDNIAPESHPLFRFILTRNGHNVALYGGLAKCMEDLKDRQRRFPLDAWGVIDRFEVKR